MIFSTALPFDGGSLGCSPDGAWIAVGTTDLFNHNSSNRALAVVGAGIGEIGWQIPERRVDAVQFTLDGALIATGRDDGTVRVFAGSP